MAGLATAELQPVTRMSLTLARLVAVLGGLAACGDPTFTLYVNNQTESEYIVLAPEAGRASVRVPPNASGVVAGSSIALVGFRGEALVLTPDCVLLESLRVPSDTAVIQISSEQIAIQSTGRDRMPSTDPLPGSSECEELLAPSLPASP